MSTLEIEETPQSWIITVEDMIVSQCRIDYAFSLILLRKSDELSLEIRIEGNFIYFVGKKKYHLSPGKEPSKIYPALGILHKNMESLVAGKDGNLKLTLENDLHIFVPPDPNYEAWAISSRKGLLFVGLPKGIAVWKPEESLNL